MLKVLNLQLQNIKLHIYTIFKCIFINKFNEP